MSWSETSPGLYQRPLGGGEKDIVALISTQRSYAREFIKIHSFVDITAAASPETAVSAIREAWKALRLLRTPDIATMFKDGFNQYKIPSPEELEEWLNRTFVVAENDTSTADVVRIMQNRLEFLPVCYLVPRTSKEGTFEGTIILFISHWRNEASGCYRMIGQICDYASDLMTGTSTREALENHNPGSEVEFLVPTLEEIVMPNKNPTAESKARIEAHFNHYYSHLPSIDLETPVELTEPFSNVLLNRNTYSVEATSSIVSACKSQGYTVTAVVHSAYIGAVYAMANPSKHTRHYASLMPAQARPRLPPDSPYRDQGCWNAVQMLMLVVPSDHDFSARAKSLKQQYNLAASNQWWFEDCRAVLEETHLMPSKAPSAPAALPMFTSLGVVDRELLAPERGIITVRNVWGWADPMGPGCVLTMWTFGGRLNVQITWNATFHGSEQMEEMLGLIAKSLGDELGVDVGVPEVTLERY